MTDLLSAENCRARAVDFTKRAATCASPKAQSIFNRIANNLRALAVELEMRDCGHGLNVRSG